MFFELKIALSTSNRDELLKKQSKTVIDKYKKQILSKNIQLVRRKRIWRSCQPQYLIVSSYY